MADPGFTRGWTPTLEGSPTFYLANFSRKLHKNEEILRPMGTNLNHILSLFLTKKLKLRQKRSVCDSWMCLQEQSVFNRLGAAIKRPATSTTTDSEPEDACEYAGVLQPSRVKKKKIDDKPKATPTTMKGMSVRARLGRAATILAMEILQETESQYLSNDKCQ